MTIQIDLDQAYSSLHGWYYFPLHVLAYATHLPSLVGHPPSPFKLNLVGGTILDLQKSYKDNTVSLMLTSVILLWYICHN